MEPANLNTIGLMGGMSSAATAAYYDIINQKVKTVKGGHNIAEIIICSVNFAVIEQYIREEAWEEAAHYLVEKAERLEAAGVSCIFLGTNTMHRVREQIKAAISIPFIDIFETVSAEIKSQGKSTIGLLGTYPVMSDNFFVQAYQDCGIEVMTPSEEEKKEIDRIIFEELTQHQINAAAKAYYLEVIRKMAAQGAEGVILGCTEIKLLVQQEDIPEVPLFDTLELHCEKAARICMGEAP
jgi:aspartate racemase